MTIFFARAAVPMWIIGLGLGIGAYFAPAAIAWIMLLVALCLVCIPAVITAGLRKRTLRETPSETMDGWHRAKQQGEIIDAEFEVHDVPPSDDAKQ